MPEEGQAAETPAAPAAPPPEVAPPPPEVAPEPSPEPQRRKPQRRDERVTEILRRRPAAEPDEPPPAVAEGAEAAEPPAAGETEQPETEAAAETEEAETEHAATGLSDDESRRLADLIGDSDENVDALRRILEHGNIAATFKAMKDRTKKLKERERAVEAKEAEQSTGEQQWQADKAELERMATEEPQKLLAKLGVTLRQLADHEVATAEPEEKRELRAANDRIAALEKRLEERDESQKKAAEEQERAALEQRISGAKTEILNAALAGKESDYSDLWTFAEIKLRSMGVSVTPQRIGAAIAEEAWDIASRAGKKAPPIEDLLAGLNNQASSWLDSAHESRSRSKDRRADPAPASVAPQPSQPADPAPPPTNSALTERGGGSSEKRQRWTRKSRLEAVLGSSRRTR